MPHAARNQDPAPGQPAFAPGWEQTFRNAILAACKQRSCCDGARLAELAIEEMRPDAFARAAFNERVIRDAEERAFGQGYAAGLAARKPWLRSVRALNIAAIASCTAGAASVIGVVIGT